MVVYTSTIVSVVVFVLLASLSYFEIIEVEPLTFVDFLIFAVLSGTGIYGGYEYARMRRIKLIDSYFPDFVRDLAESRKAGMTFTKAIFLAAKGNYGPLTPEIKKMAQQISWGSSVNEALSNFAERVDTKLVRRSVSLINEASRGGGSVADVLEAAAKDAREMQHLKVKRKTSMSSYVIIVYLSTFVFIAIVLALTKSILPSLGESLAKSAGIGGVVAGGGGALSIKELVGVFFFAAIIQSFGSGLVAGVFETGDVRDGVKHSFILVLVSWLIFKVSVTLGWLPASPFV